MAQTATNPKIEELRAKLRADPKSRLFYQLAEELRRAGQSAEAEQILRSGLGTYPAYLAAWVSLGRVCRELQKDRDAVEALNRAMQLDPGNVVAARLLGDAWLALGEKVEAIKKYKFVRAVLPSDEDLEGIIVRLDRELNASSIALSDAGPEAEGGNEAAEPDQEPEGPEQRAGVLEAVAQEASPPEFEARAEEPPAEEPRPKVADPDAVTVTYPLFFTHQDAPDAALPEGKTVELAPYAPEEESPFDKTQPPFGNERAGANATADAEPMLLSHDESPFEEPAPGYTAASAEIEAASGFSIEPAPVSAALPAGAGDFLEPEAEEESDVFEPASTTVPDGPIAGTETMADLYARQGLTEDARHIYESVLEREPDNAAVRGKLESLRAPEAPRQSVSETESRVARLEQWLARVSGKGAAGHV